MMWDPWDGGRLIHEIPPKGSQVTFQEYASKTFMLLSEKLHEIAIDLIV